MDTLKRDVVSPLWHQWHSIEWSAVSGRVRRLQARIAKAAKESDWRKVRQLQRLITKSTSAKALAIKRVTANRGHKTQVSTGNWVNARSKMGSAANLG
ncbi:reverse transcriptase N-terminal domain-containing protein [Halopseudomonas pachastrellae]|nr:reverse transcriptase N-terminal domain-containing protein [Halopseudomonas pachastrellae]